jgi:hypothetical protein
MCGGGGSGGSGVSQIVAGTGITISPTSGTGVVTINSTGGGTIQPMIEFVAASTGSGRTFTAANLATFTNNTYAAVYINGTLQRTAAYTISGTTLTFNTWINTGDKISVGPTGAGGSGGNISSINLNGNSSTYLNGAGNWVAISGTGYEQYLSLGTGTTIDVSLANYFSKTITGPTSLSPINVPAGPSVGCYILELTNAGTNVTWWSGITWASGTPPTLTTSGTDVLGFYSYNGGAFWRGLVLAKDIR